MCVARFVAEGPCALLYIACVLLESLSRWPKDQDRQAEEATKLQL